MRLGAMSMLETEQERRLNVMERLGRAVSFYSKAVPVFASYKFLEISIDLQRNVFGKNVSIDDEEMQWSQLHDWGSDVITDIINELKGFYVKTGQIISTRVDIFPEQYTSKLSSMQDSLDPVPAEQIKEIIRKELLNGAPLTDLFCEFDDIPLGSASIAQVHRAKLLDGRIVAVKVQRPEIEGKLLGDIANLKNFAKAVQDTLAVDYYKVFCELERTLIYELDFMHEAQATQKVAGAVAHTPNNKPKKAPVIVPLPIPGLVSRRVMVMEFIDGKALSKVANEMKALGIEAGSPESQLFGRKLLSALTDAYARMIFGSGIIHGDPHPEVCLLDCGQVKVMTTKQRLDLAQLLLFVNAWEKATNIEPDGTAANDIKKIIAQRVRDQGVIFEEGAGDDCAASVAILLFGNTDTKLPGGYVGEEISFDSPIAQVVEFPQEFVLLGRATVMIKGIANRLGVSWGLSDRWAPVAQEALEAILPAELLPIWGAAVPTVPSCNTFGGSDAVSGVSVANSGVGGGVTLGEVMRSVRYTATLALAFLGFQIKKFIIDLIPLSVKKKILRWGSKLFLQFQK
eukprot:gene519-995_t